LEFLLPLIFLHAIPFFEEILRFWADNEIEDFVEKLDIGKESAYSKDFLASFELEVTEGEKTTSIIGSSFKIFDIAKLVKEFLHEFVTALLRYIFDKHFLPHFLFRTH